MNTALIIQVEFKKSARPHTLRTADAKLAEASGLAEAIDLQIVHEEILTISRPRAATLLGTGVIERIAGLVETLDYPLIIINASLTPVQHRNLEQALNSKVIDRTALILEIFGARAQTHAGRLQVELAALTFQKSRLVRSWTHLERQRGGGSFLGGPGERQIELDRRMLTLQLQQIKKELRDVTRTRSLQRSNRQRSQTPTIALIGYTNAGKSTLFNRLTGAKVMAKDMLFATLDPTIRGATLPSGRSVVISDTVGFISELPTELIEAFKSTLEEVVEAALILHIHDYAAPLCAEEAGDVSVVLEKIGIDSLNRNEKIIHVFNKIDILASTADRPYFADGITKQAVSCSAVTGEGIDQLLVAIDGFFSQGEISLNLKLSPAQAPASAWLHQHGRIDISNYDEEGCQSLVVVLNQANLAKFQKNWPDISVQR